MKYLILLLFGLLLQSCKVIETLEINADGSGKMSILQQRDEQSYMNMYPETYALEQDYNDKTLVFKDLMALQNDVISRMSITEQSMYKKFENTTITIVNNSDTKEMYRKFESNFLDINNLPDLYKSYEYYDNIVHNYALSAEEHYSNLEFFYDGKIFRRKASIINEAFYKKEMLELNEYQEKLNGKIYTVDYVLKYQFPKKIKTISNPNAKISTDRKSIEITFSIIEAKKYPEKTNFEVVFEE